MVVVDSGKAKKSNRRCGDPHRDRCDPPGTNTEVVSSPGGVDLMGGEHYLVGVRLVIVDEIKDYSCSSV